MIDSIPSEALISGTEVYRPTSTILNNLLDRRLINQVAFLHFSLRLKQTLPLKNPQTYRPSEFSSLLFTPGQQLDTLARMWAAGLIRSFSASWLLQYKMAPPPPRDRAELKSLYQQKIIDLKQYVREAVILDYPFTSTTAKISLNWEKLATDWELTLTQVTEGLRNLERKKEITLSLPTTPSAATYVTVNWHSGKIPAIGLNLAELKKMRSLKLLNENGFTYLAARANTTGTSTKTINIDAMESAWEIGSTKAFEAIAMYQSRDLASVYLENVSLTWIELPAYFPRDLLLKRKGFYRDQGWLWYALRSENPAGDLTQAIKISQVESAWDIHKSDVIKFLKRLTAAAIAQADISSFTITWK